MGDGVDSTTLCRDLIERYAREEGHEHAGRNTCIRELTSLHFPQAVCTRSEGCHVSSCRACWSTPSRTRFRPSWAAGSTPLAAGFPFMCPYNDVHLCMSMVFPHTFMTDGAVERESDEHWYVGDEPRQKGLAV